MQQAASGPGYAQTVPTYSTSAQAPPSQLLISSSGKAGDPYFCHYYDLFTFLHSQESKSAAEATIS
jgi:hypothetical protein